jgi:hypothetical protein
MNFPQQRHADSLCAPVQASTLTCFWTMLVLQWRRHGETRRGNAAVARAHKPDATRAKGNTDNTIGKYTLAQPCGRVAASSVIPSAGIARLIPTISCRTAAPILGAAFFVCERT